MAFYQCDSSALVKRYVDEVGTAWIRAVVDPASANIISIADITRAEMTSAFARRAREGVITLNERMVGTCTTDSLESSWRNKTTQKSR